MVRSYIFTSKNCFLYIFFKLVKNILFIYLKELKTFTLFLEIYILFLEIFFLYFESICISLEQYLFCSFGCSWNLIEAKLNSFFFRIFGILYFKLMIISFGWEKKIAQEKSTEIRIKLLYISWLKTDFTWFICYTFTVSVWRINIIMQKTIPCESINLNL